MKTISQAILLIVAAVISGTIKTPAATFTNLHTFSTESPLATNADGSSPEAALVSSGGTLYGPAADAGPGGFGAVFAVNTDGTGFTLLHSFSSRAEGSGPLAALAVAGDMLYGTTRAGGSNDLGTVFALSTNGTGFVTLHSFGGRLGPQGTSGLNTNSGGAFPETDLVWSDNSLYGATEQGGPGGNGTLFKINTDGSAFTVLHNFTNIDGGYPSIHMVLSGSNLFGTTVFGGTATGLGNGTIFRINTDGTGFTNLYKFSDTVGGATPKAGLVLSGSTLYGTTPNGAGPAAYGTVFRINTDGTGFTNFYILNVSLNAGSPSGGLAIAGNTIYATELGFATFGGTVFQVNTDGTGYTNLTSFNNRGDPGTLSGLTLAGGNLYGTSSSGGTNNTGTVFALGLPSAPVPLLGLQRAGESIILTWNAPASFLYTAPTVNGTFAKVSNAASPYTNAVSGAQGYFQLH